MKKLKNHFVRKKKLIKIWPTQMQTLLPAYIIADCRKCCVKQIQILVTLKLFFSVNSSQKNKRKKKITGDSIYSAFYENEFKKIGATNPLEALDEDQSTRTSHSTCF